MHEVFRAYFNELVQAMISPLALIPAFYSEHLISDTDKTRLRTVTHTDDIEKAIMLLSLVENKIKAAPEAAKVVRVFCKAVSNQPALNYVVEKITAVLGK